MPHTRAEVVVPTVLTLKLAVAALTVVPPPFGSLPSVVYVMLLTSEPPSVALIETATGAEAYQPAEQAALLHWIELLGAAASAWAVKARPEPVRPALLLAVIDPLCVVDEASNV